MSLPPGFAEKVASYSDLHLAEVIESASDYTPEALEIVMSEWNRRKLTVDAIVDGVAEMKRRKELAKKPNPTKPKLVKGIGVICYGQNYKMPIGYTTTQWFCIFFVPLVPLQCFHVRAEDFGADGLVVSLPIDWQQAARIYIFMASMLCLACGLWWGSSQIYDSGHEYWSVVLWLTMLVPFFAVQFLRMSVRRNRPNQSLEPTGLAVTPSAGAEAAPAKPVAHH